VFPREREQLYLAALEREIRACRWQWPPETVYLGGGTPSNLDPQALGALLNAIPGRPWREATLEAAPGTINAEKARAWTRLGVGRISLGVQSFVEAEIRRTGRKHTAQTVVREMQILAQQGIVNCNLDLIAGLPGQTAATWRESLDWIERLAPAHVSVYMLEVDEDSRLGREILHGGRRYGADEIPTDDQIADFYEEAVERLAAMGIRRYEISNFARPGFESRHNLKYWKLAPYVGFGVDAHSFDGRVRRRNPESLEDYLNPAGATASAEDPADPAERFYVGLRLSEGIHPTAAERARFERPIRRFIDAGLLEADAGTLRLTGRGVLLSNEVFQEFLTV
jgi:oxygen-independent coproporphyrinogen III oxidase